MAIKEYVVVHGSIKQGKNAEGHGIYIQAGETISLEEAEALALGATLQPKALWDAEQKGAKAGAKAKAEALAEVPVEVHHEKHAKHDVHPTHHKGSK